MSVVERKIKKESTVSAALKREVAKAFREVFSDPDFGLELRPEFVRRLKKSQKSGSSRSLSEYLKG